MFNFRARQKLATVLDKYLLIQKTSVKERIDVNRENIHVDVDEPNHTLQPVFRCVESIIRSVPDFENNRYTISGIFSLRDISKISNGANWKYQLTYDLDIITIEKEGNSIVNSTR